MIVGNAEHQIFQEIQLHINSRLSDPEHGRGPNVELGRRNSVLGIIIGGASKAVEEGAGGQDSYLAFACLLLASQVALAWDQYCHHLGMDVANNSTVQFFAWQNQTHCGHRE